MDCKFAGICSGCSWINKSLAEQRELKKKALLDLFSSKQVHYSGDLGFSDLRDSGLRDRADLSFVMQDGKLVLGLYQINSKKLVDIDECPQMSDRLNVLLRKFRENLPPIDFGSVRLRVSPKGDYGFWLDIPNLSVKFLLEERKYLQKLMSMGRVEIGQKRKLLVEEEQGLKLKDASFFPWFETYIGEDLRPSPLNCLVGGFTQVGFDANRALISAIQSSLKDYEIQRALELCSGSGNLSLALASWGITVSALEIDDFAVKAAEDSANMANLSSRIQSKKCNVHKKSKLLEEEFSKVDLVLVDPPRSGLGASLNVIEELDEEIRPKHFLYVSCYLPSLGEDLAKLVQCKYQVRKVLLVDQFAHSPHCEYVVLLTR